MNIDATEVDQIRSLLQGEIDWPFLAATATRHGVLPLLYQNLTRIGAQGIPQEFSKYFRANAARNLALAGELTEILGLFRSDGLQALPFKGPLLAVAAYGKLSLRYAGDLDILIRRRDLEPAMRLLFARGYRLLNGIDPHNPPEPTVTEYQFQSAKEAMIVELRWRITESWLPASLDLDQLIARAETRDLEGVQILSLAPEETLLTLCVHGAKHKWERLMWICDVAELLNANPALGWSRLREHSRALSLWGQVLLGLLLARQVLGVRIPPEALKWREDLSAVEREAAQLHGRLFDSESAPRHILAARLEDARYWISMLESPDERLRQGLRFLFRLLPGAHANERDRRFARLPQRYRLLYPLLRPVRLARDYLFGWKPTER